MSQKEFLRLSHLSVSHGGHPPLNHIPVLLLLLLLSLCHVAAALGLADGEPGHFLAPHGEEDVGGSEVGAGLRLVLQEVRAVVAVQGAVEGTAAATAPVSWKKVFLGLFARLTDLRLFSVFGNFVLKQEQTLFNDLRH